MINGVLNVYKEAGYTSHDVVAKLRGILKQKKIGHTGTLDPDAVGVLPVCLGKATRLCDMLTDKDKTYKTTMLLGLVTDTQDISGNILSKCQDDKVLALTEKEITDAVHYFIGEYDQIPPMYSAIKIDGKKLYELARQGKEIERPARKVKILNINILDIDLPRVVLEVECSKGTYIRTLCHDIGERLGCGACVEKLTRTRVDRFSIEDSITLDKIKEIYDQGSLEKNLVALDEMLDKYRKVNVSEDYNKLIYNGNLFPAMAVINDICPKEDERLRVYDAGDNFIGVYQYSKKIYRPFKIFL